MTKDEALKLALEALENAIAVRNGEGGTKFVDPLEPNAITAIQEALAQPEKTPAAQPEQEPFGYLSISDTPIFQKEIPEIGQWETLYTTPQSRPWVGLTKVEVFVESKHWRNPEAFIHGAGWAEDTLKEKNT
jgi:hypothetical protein